MKRLIEWVMNKTVWEIAARIFARAFVGALIRRRTY